MQALTPRQQLFLDFLRQHHAAHGYWPSIRDIQDHFGLRSTNGVSGHLRALERKGVIQRIPGAARAYRFTGENAAEISPAPEATPAEWDNLIDLPVYGSIAAGFPEGTEPAGTVARVQLDAASARVRHPRGAFALRVRGESMIDAGIFDGDTVILEQGEPRDGDIVAALIDGQTTLKRFIKKKNKPAFLKAENPVFPDLLPLAELLIQGIARSVLRPLC